MIIKQARASGAKGRRLGHFLLALAAGVALFGAVLRATAGMAAPGPALDPWPGTAPSIQATAPDLALAKTGPQQALPGASITYTLTYSNQGDAPAEGVVLSDRLPAGVTYQQAAPPGHLAGTGVYTWYIGTIVTGTDGAASIVLTATVATTLSGGSHLVNSVEIASTVTETITANNHAAVTTTVVVADVGVFKIAASEVRPDHALTYTLAYINAGGAAAGAVLITDTLPLGLSYQDSQGPLPPPTVVGRWVTWDGGTLAPGDGGTLILTTTVAATLPAGATLLNNVEISTTTPEDVVANNSDQQITLVIPDVPHDLDLAVTPDQLVVGGEAALVTATVRDRWGNLVADGTGVDFSVTGPGSVSPPSQLTANGVATTTLTSATTPGTIRVTAQVDSLTRNATVTVVAGPPADLELEVFPPALTVDQAATASATVWDAYSNPVADGTVVTFATTLGAVTPESVGTTDGWVATTITSTQVGTATVSAGTQGVAPRTDQVYFGPGMPRRVEVVADPLAIPVDGASTTIHAAVLDQYDNGVGDGYPVNFTTTLGTLVPLQTTTQGGEATATLTSGPASGVAVVTATRGLLVGATEVPFLPADLAITKTVSSDTAVPGQLVTYTITYLNRGAARARGVSLVDEPSDKLVGLAYISSGATITRTPGTTYTWQVADLSLGEGGVITMTARPDPSLLWPETLFNRASIRTQTAEDRTDNNLSGASLLVVTADLYVGKDLDEAFSSQVPGGQLVYDVYYGNQGYSQAAGIRITDTLPDFTSFVREDLTFAPGLQRVTEDEARTQVWEKTGLVGSNERFRVWLAIDPQAPGGEEIVNTVEVATETPESNYANNVATDSVTILGANLTVSKFGPTRIKPSQLITYQMNVFSTGTIEATDTVLTDVLPSGVSYQHATPPGDPLGGGAYRWELGSLMPASSRTIVLTGYVSPEAPAGADLVNRVQVSTNKPESHLADNQHVLTTTIIPGLPYTVTVQSHDPAINLDGATTVVTATVTDRFGNGVTDGTAVTLTTTLGTITPTAGSTLQGEVTATLRSGTLAGLTQVTATSDGRAGATLVEFLPDPPYSLTLHVAPQVLTADGVATATLTVTATDRFANLVADGTVVTLTATNASPLPEQATTQDGVATTTVRAGTIAGTAVVTATAGAATGTITLRLDPGPPGVLTLTTSPPAIVADGVATATLAVTVTDLFHNRVPDGTEVHLWGEGVTVWPTGTTTLDGVAVGGVQAGTRAGVAYITATAGSALGVGTIQLLPGPPFTATMTANPDSLVANGVATSTLTITLTDRYENLVADGTQVNLAATGASVPESVSTVDGVAQAVLTAGTVAGSAHVTATAGSAVTTTTLRLDPGPPWAIGVTPSSEQLTADGVSTVTLTILVADQFDNSVADDTPVMLTATLGTVEPPLVLTHDGQASATFQAGTRGGEASIVARAGDAVGWASVRLLPGPPHFVTVVADPPAIVADGVSTATLVITVTDQYANLVSDGYEVHLTTSQGQLSPDVGLTQGGRVTAQFTAGTRSGPATVTATVDSRVGTGIVALLPGPPAHLHVEVLPAVLPAEGLATAAVTVMVMDDFENPVADDTPVALTATLSTISPTLTTTVDGVVTATLRAGVTLGTAVVTATSGTGVGVAWVELVPGPPARVEVTAWPDRISADGSSTATIRATVDDSVGHPVADGTYAFFATTLGEVEPRLRTTHGGVVTTTLRAGTRSGRALVTVAVGDKSGETTVELLPGPPYDLEVIVEPARVWADGLATATFTITVTDRYDNPVTDGTPVTLTTSLGSFPTGTTYATETLGGVARAVLRAPSRPGVALVQIAADHHVLMAKVTFYAGRLLLPLVSKSRAARGNPTEGGQPGAWPPMTLTRGDSPLGGSR